MNPEYDVDPEWPRTAAGVVEFMRARVAEAEADGQALTVKEFGQLPMDDLSAADVAWLRSTFKVVVLVREPLATLASLARISDFKAEYDHHEGWAALARAAALLPPQLVISAEQLLLDAQAVQTRVWGRTAHAGSLELPALSPGQRWRAAFHFWPKWFERALESRSFTSEPSEHPVSSLEQVCGDRRRSWVAAVARPRAGSVQHPLRAAAQQPLERATARHSGHATHDALKL